ncbi:hypothetical protein CTI12_AA401190 [Artemisia annua]|uniref:Ubiquitin-like protease family profile domain-containing protein n=1 Tax=Artemisia annua TaxID=35608 RepID=A0A2U1MAC5_ARTAN|nr:hypothetical protein CTI12_AA401190 [Artemisia annua]
MKDVKHEMRAPVEEETEEEEKEVNEEVVDKGLNGMSKSELVKKLADMERELTNYKTISTRLTTIEQLLKPQTVHTVVQKAESIRLKIGEALTGGQNSVIASNGVKGCETGCNNLVDVAVGVDYVVNKQNDEGVRKEPDVSVDLLDSVNNRNLVDVCVSVSKQNDEGVKKHKHDLVDECTAGRVVETGTNVANNCVSKPFDGDTAVECKTVCVDKFVTNVSTDHVFGDHASQDNNADEMMHMEEEVQDICPSPSKGLVAVEALMDLISFTPPLETSHGVNDMERDNNVDILQVNDDMPDVEIINSAQNHQKVKTVQVPFARERKKSVYLQDPFTDPPPTTPRVRRKRKQKVHKKTVKTLLGSDGKEIELQPWNEVYFPVNKTEVHWVLAELDICSGVITLYDSLGGPKNPDQDGWPWWENWRNVLAEHLPLYLYESEVNTSIIVDASDPLEVALAYREQLTSFYWKYKMIVPDPNLM